MLRAPGEIGGLCQMAEGGNRLRDRKLISPYCSSTGFLGLKAGANSIQESEHKMHI